ncbi:peptidoglycan editing factor PgeF [Thioalkalivibrio sp. ALR17-21]|uniref:peptidoglycan editing factor PgeF n=1 Tax=Thioalkalivibrio sp. ALR17-21 TaxID=1269813 RepID=UPI00040887F7|nr:peptidoglycan editing factor PgeF [Thioalkalivibrio sp. ALR17-21]
MNAADALPDEALITPDWPAAPAVGALQTTRAGGISEGVWASLNLALHTGDDPQRVAGNRRRLAQAVAARGVPDAELHWPAQVHGTRVVRAEELAAADAPVEADAVMTTRPDRVCAVQTADCLPVLFAGTGGEAVAAAHAGWRGLVDGVLEATLAALREARPQAAWHAWLGPAIGPDAFEVGTEVRDRFLAVQPHMAGAFRPAARDGHWLADLAALARDRLQRAGVAVHGGGECTFSDPDRFFSYRRDGTTGRQASLLWIRPQAGA